MSNDAPTYNPSDFDTSPFVKRIEKPWGYELHLISPNAPYMFKIMHINAGCRQSMQLHDQKSETYLVIGGKAAVLWENSSGDLIQTDLHPEQGYSTQVGQRHRLIGITDCDIVEASTPELGTTWRLDDDYARPNETPEQRAADRQSA